ncbi:MAG TPA: ABC transporter ATP-binding protein [Sedimentisphaerales bacterium]|jgi:iron complex transport system ATP-binding protein|nr:ABC transporter ATP-binding protein [Sedimentisphaerales bacterium]HNU29699.1 ABC transporter ATP-binding protein [Sedimentisphaerales bacterium]
MTAAIEVKEVSFGYGPHRPVLNHIDLAVRAGTFLAVVGPNGAGKSTLVKIMAGLLKPQSGSVLLEGRELYSYGVQEIARRIAVVRQEFVPAFEFSVLETVLMARTPRYGSWGFESEQDRTLANRALEMTDTARFASRPLGSLSCGERQRVFIARALAQDTPILLLDEPTSFLDLRHQVDIYDLLKSIQQKTTPTIIAVTHDINLASQYCDEALLLYPPAPSGDMPIDERSAAATRCRVGPISEVLTLPEIQQAFDVQVFSGAVGRERFIVPLGIRAKDADRAGRST